MLVLALALALASPEDIPVLEDILTDCPHIRPQSASSPSPARFHSPRRLPFPISTRLPGFQSRGAAEGVGSVVQDRVLVRVQVEWAGGAAGVAAGVAAGGAPGGRRLVWWLEAGRVGDADVGAGRAQRVLPAAGARSPQVRDQRARLAPQHVEHAWLLGFHGGRTGRGRRAAVQAVARSWTWLLGLWWE